jgi:membrane protein YqaA with SNARE-associated domain
MDDSAEYTGQSQYTKEREYLIGIIGLVLTLALCMLVILNWDWVHRAARYGYIGVFVINILAGATTLIPIPGLLVVFTLGRVLHPAIVEAAAGLGEAIGSITIYITGYGGHRAIRKLERVDSLFTSRLESLLQRRGSISVFLMSSIINPLFFPFTALAGALHFGLVKFFVLCWAGKP